MARDLPLFKRQKVVMFMSSPQQYFNRLLPIKNMIIKVNNFELIIYPEMETQEGMIGFKSECKARAFDLEGVVSIDVKFIIPKGGMGKEFAVDNEKLNETIDKLEFIKTTDDIPMNMTASGYIYGEAKKQDETTT